MFFSKKNLFFQSTSLNISLTWMLTAFFFAFQFFLRSSPNGMKEQLLEEFSLSLTSFGFLASVYYWPYAFMQIPVGLLLDKIGPKTVLRFGSLLCVVGTFCFAFAPSFPLALLSRFCIGLGASVGFISGVRLHALWIPKKYLAFSIGSLQAAGKILGGAFSVGFLKFFVQWAGNWRSVLLFLGCFGLSLVGLIWLFIKNGPQDDFHQSVAKASQEQEDSSQGPTSPQHLQEGPTSPQHLRESPQKNFQSTSSSALKTSSKKSPFSLLFQRNILLLCLFGYSLYTMLSVFGDVYSADFLQLRLSLLGQTLGSEKSWMSSLVFLGSATGAPFFSFVSDFFKKRKFFLLLCSFMVLLLSSLLFYGPLLGSFGVMMLLYVVGFFTGGYVLIFAMATDLIPPKSLGIILGAMNGSMILSGALHNALAGYLLQYFSLYEKGVLTLLAYEKTFCCLSVMFLASFLGACFLPESHPRRKKHQNLQGLEE